MTYMPKSSFELQKMAIEMTSYHAKYFAHELTKKSPSDSIEKFTRTLSDAQVDLNPHQIDAALFAFKSPLSRGAILADEVGLGKTIEAGIVLSQKWAEGKRKILIICPSGLRKQWNQELYEKFFLKSKIIDSQSFKKYTVSGRYNPFEQDEIVICSYHFAKSKEEYIQNIKWDLAVLDEAHKLRNVFQPTNKISKSIKRSLCDSPKLLLTATPLQNSLLELYGLVSFIDEHLFGDLQSYKSQFVRLFDETQSNYEDLKNRLTPICKRTLRRQVLEYIKYTNRIPITQEYIPTEAEQKLYNNVSEWLQKEKLYSLPSGQRHLMTLIMRRLLASSTFAIAGTIKGLIARLNKSLEIGTLRNTSEYIKDTFSDMDDLSEELEDTEDDTKPLTNDEKQGIREEIQELEEFSKLAESIKFNAKGDELLTALEKGFDKLQVLKGPRKALIFTEFRRTQDYIYNLLLNTKYKDDIVIFNGSNNDEKSNKIYSEWLEKNKSTDKITGSTSADKRAAIIDYFRNTASIMIATEAAAEGLNLQFCSLVVNYDLPWNPQRIEQRIGRCHRYGQNYDVVVINFINTKNEADKRVFELLDKKFKLFDGVFGASDEVLGTVESGIDFEKRISQIYQECRTPDEIKASFDALQKELEEQILTGMKDAKKKLLENFDEEVHEKLKVSLSESKEYLNKFEKIFWHLTLFELSKYAQFDIENNSFTLKSSPFKSRDIKLGKYKLGKKIADAHIYRVGLPLAQEIIRKAINETTPIEKIIFNYSEYKNKISCIEELKGQEGDLILWKLKLIALDDEEYLIFTSKTDNGEWLSKEQCERLFDIGGQVYSDEKFDEVAPLEEDFERKKKKLINTVTEKNTIYFDEEMTKLEKWGEDKKNTLKQKLKDLDEKIKIMKKDNRLSTNLQEKLKKQKEIRELDKKRDSAWKEYEDKKRDIDRQVDDLIDKVQAKMEQKIQAEKIFSIRWKVI